MNTGRGWPAPQTKDCKMTVTTDLKRAIELAIKNLNCASDVEYAIEKAAHTAAKAVSSALTNLHDAEAALAETKKLFQVILKTDYCPGGPLSTKTKQNDGSWHQIHGYSNGSSMVFKTLKSAEKEAQNMARPSSDRILAAWAEPLDPELTARLIKSRFPVLA